MKISVAINTYNSEKTLRACLDSVKDFDEILVCDMYSEDRTLEIAEEYGAKIFMHEKTGYVEPARNFVISKAENDWVLVVDSDETITSELREFLYNFLEDAQDYSAVKIPRLNYYLGEPLEILYPDRIIRFIKKDDVIWLPTIHSTPQLERGRLFVVDEDRRELAIHHAYTSGVSELLNTINKYTDIELSHKIERDDKLENPFFAVWKSLLRMFEVLILKGGYKDGFRGFIVAVVVFGLYKFCIYAKYWEYKKKSEITSLPLAKKLFPLLFGYSFYYIKSSGEIDYKEFLDKFFVICDFTVDEKNFFALTKEVTHE